MSDSHATPDHQPDILRLLPDFPISGQRCAIRIQQQLDLMLIALESLDVRVADFIVSSIKDWQLDHLIKNRIVLWRLRCTNPWRRSYVRDHLTLDQAKSLVILISHQAKLWLVMIRDILLAEQQMRTKGLPLETNFLLCEYLERFRANFRSRMNPRRAKVSIYQVSEDELNELALSLLNQLLFCTGTTGMQRLWISLFDGEVA